MVQGVFRPVLFDKEAGGLLLQLLGQARALLFQAVVQKFAEAIAIYAFVVAVMIGFVF